MFTQQGHRARWGRTFSGESVGATGASAESAMLRVVFELTTRCGWKDVDGEDGSGPDNVDELSTLMHEGDVTHHNRNQPKVSKCVRGEHAGVCRGGVVRWTCKQARKNF